MAGFILNAVLVIGIGVVLFSMAPFLGLFVLIPAPFVLVATLYYHRRMNPHFRRYWISRWRLNSMLNTFLSGIQVVKAFGQDDQEEERYHDLNTKCPGFAPAGRPGLGAFLPLDFLRFWRRRLDYLVCGWAALSWRIHHTGYPDGLPGIPGYVLRSFIEHGLCQPGAQPLHNHFTDEPSSSWMKNLRSSRNLEQQDNCQRLTAGSNSTMYFWLQSILSRY